MGGGNVWCVTTTIHCRISMSRCEVVVIMTIAVVVVAIVAIIVVVLTPT